MATERNVMRRAAALGAVAFLAGTSSCDSSSSAGTTNPLPPPPSTIPVVASVPMPEYYGIHDMYVRDGIAFVCAWDSGLMVYDVGNGIRGGSPRFPIRVSKLVTPGGAVHNAWWFHNPATGERKYLFVGQEGHQNF